jgi:DNA repair protein RadC
MLQADVDETRRTTTAIRARRGAALSRPSGASARAFSQRRGGRANYELLELALFAALPRRDTKPLAKSLLKTFGSFAEVIHAPETRLREVDGIGEASIQQIKLLAAAATRIAKGQLKQRMLLSSWNDVIDYCRTSMVVSDDNIVFTLFGKKPIQLR